MSELCNLASESHDDTMTYVLDTLQLVCKVCVCALSNGTKVKLELCA